MQGRFVVDDDEVVLTRVVPRTGRSRAYRDGRLITAGELTDLAGGLVDLHAQHAHVGLLTTASQRRALDRFAGVDLHELEAARAALRAAERELDVARAATRRRASGSATSSATSSTRSKRAGLTDVGEDERLAAEESVLADADAHRAAAAAAERCLGTERRGEGPAGGRARRSSAIGPRSRPSSSGCRGPSRPSSADVVRELRGRGRRASRATPSASATVQARRAELADLRRRYAGDARVHARRPLRGAGRAVGTACGSWTATRSERPRPRRRGEHGQRRGWRRPRPRSARQRRDHAPGAGRGGAGAPRRAGARQGAGRPRGGRRSIPATRSRSSSPSTPAFPPRRWPRPRPVVSWRARCSPCASSSARRCRRSSSTRSTPASVGRRREPWAGRWPRWPRRSRCWSSPTCPRSPRSPTPRSP